MKFHEQLKLYRENLNIPQNEIAKRLNVSPSALSRYENGIRQIPVDRLHDFKTAYNISDDRFFHMLLQTGSKRNRIQPDQLNELQTAYYNSFYSANKELLFTDSFRSFFTSFASLTEVQQKEMLKKFTAEMEKLHSLEKNEEIE